MKTIMLICALLMAACGPISEKMKPNETAAAAGSITYKRDPANGLCFAFTSSTTYYGYQVVVFTSVPQEACR